MVYVRPAFDKILTQSITTRARDPDTSLTVQRNIDEAFRAINGLRVLSGASPEAIARALNFSRALNSVSARFTLGTQDQQPSVNEPSQPVFIQETESHTLNDMAGLSDSAFHWTDGLTLPYPWSIEKVQFGVQTFPSGASGQVRVAVLLGSPGPVGGSQLSTNASGTTLRNYTDFGIVTLPRSIIKGQETLGGRREIAAGQTVFLRYLFALPLPHEVRAFPTTLTILADKTVGV